jgi:PAS domain S-box-containing protein
MPPETAIPAESAFRTFFDASPYGQMLVDPTGMIVLVNRALADILGYPPDSLAGRPLSLLLPNRHRGGHDGLLQGYFADPQVRMMGTGRDLTARHADGTEVPVEVGLSTVPWGGQQHAVATVADISLRTRLELQLRRANASLEEFLYVASHDLRSPLRGISDLLEWVGEDLVDRPPPQVQRNLDRIRLRIDRMQALMDALLAYARSSGTRAETRPVDATELIAGVLELDPLPAGFDLHLDVRIEPFLAARTPLETVVRNLIRNAVEHHDRPRGRITVSARPDGAYCRLEITDDGPGIPPAAQERIFRLFQTLADTGGPHRSGIGLAMVKRLVGAHGGRIEVASPAEPTGTRGSTFRVWWPRFPRRDLDDA